MSESQHPASIAAMSVVGSASPRRATRMGVCRGEAEELPPMDLHAFPTHDAGESLETYLRRTLFDDRVSVGALARHLDVLRGALYKVRNGGGMDMPSLIRFGALTGVLVEDEPTLALLRLLDLEVEAQAGWASRTFLQAEDAPESLRLEMERCGKLAAERKPDFRRKDRRPTDE